MSQADILTRIIEHKYIEIADRQQRISLASLKTAVTNAPLPRGFTSALKTSATAGKPAVIAEVKKASPSKGIIRKDFDVASIVSSYVDAGATCLSVLTDENFFQGNDEYLEVARSQCGLPILRKDFIVDPYQVYETRAMGADCLLLIVSALSEEKLTELYQLARSLSMDVLIEVHDADELAQALRLTPDLVGINNRNLHTFETSLDVTIELLPHIPDNCLVVTESGIHTREDVDLMNRHGVYSFLVGESLMRVPDPGVKFRELFGDLT